MAEPTSEATRPFRDSARRAATAALLAAATGGIGAGYLMRRINTVRHHPADALDALRGEASNALFEKYPNLARRIPWRPLGNFPTPVEEIAPPTRTGAARLFIKRDDLASPRYGGNKVRKLEHFLADAHLSDRRTLITLGGLGSNHALATALHGGALGFAVELALYDQPTTPAVRANLGGFLAAGARIHHAGGIPGAFLTAGRLYRNLERGGAAPYFIMVGGTSRLGCIGHVTAGLELARQVDEGLVPEPDAIFLPLGTAGTAAGLLAGLRLGGLGSRLHAVRVADPFPANRTVLRYLAQDVADFLHRCDHAVPRIRVEEGDFRVHTEYFGEGYGVPTAAAEDAVRRGLPELRLETTYTGKAFAACLRHCEAAPKDEKVLFWNTFNSAPVPAPDDWSVLPPDFHYVLAG